MSGPDVLHHLITGAGWRPALIVRVRGLAGEVESALAGVPILTVPDLRGPETWRALVEHGIRGALAVGIADRFEDELLRALPGGVYGLHPSLLPAMAGPAAVNWALIQGLTSTGATLLRHTSEGNGWQLVAQSSCPIGERETAASLGTKLSAAAAELWARHWPAIARGTPPLRPGEPLIPGLQMRPEDGLIRWARHSAVTLDRWIRALSRPSSGAYFWFGDRRIWVHHMERDQAPARTVDQPTLVSVSPDAVTLEYPDVRLRLSDLHLDGGVEVPGHVWTTLAQHAGQPLASLHKGRRVLAVAAHPDDEVLGIGGTLIRHFKRGDEVRVVVVCSAESIRYREGEHDQPGDTERASHYLGAQSTGLGFPDQRLDRGSNLELIQALEQQVQEFRPHVIYTHWWGDVNADHVRIAEAVDVAARPYAAPFLQSLCAFETPSSSEWTASERAGAFAPNVFVDISDELDRKLDAMRCYESELRPFPHPRSLESLAHRAAFWGSAANLAAAEALMLLRDRR